jgi:phage shock protein E
MNNYLIISVLLLLGYFILRTFRMNQVAKNKIKAIQNKEGGLFLVDVRQPEEYKAGSAKGAVNIPLGEVQKRISEFRSKDNIVVFCRSGNRSAQAAAILKQNHIENVTNGGTWQNVASAVGK